jgi:hypothetical protein
MKKLLTTVALLIAIGTPAFAQSYTPEFGTANISPVVTSQDATSAFAQAVPTTDPSAQAQIRGQHNAGILEGVPAGVNAYAYHEGLAASEAN